MQAMCPLAVRRLGEAPGVPSGEMCRNLIQHSCRHSSGEASKLLNTEGSSHVLQSPRRKTEGKSRQCDSKSRCNVDLTFCNMAQFNLGVLFSTCTCWRHCSSQNSQRMEGVWKPVSLEPLIKQGSGTSHPATAARKERACRTGRSNTAASRQQSFKMLEACGNVAYSETLVRKLVPKLRTRAWDGVQLKSWVPHSFFPRLKVVKKLLDTLMRNLSEAVLGNMK